MLASQATMNLRTATRQRELTLPKTIRLAWSCFWRMTGEGRRGYW